MIYRLIGIIQLHLFLFGFRWGYIIGVIGFVLGTFGSIIEPPASIFGVSTAVVSVLLGLILFWKDTLEIKRAEKDLYTIESCPVMNSVIKVPEGYTHIDFNNKYAIYSDAVNQLLSTHLLEFECESKKFMLPQSVKSIAPFILRQSFSSQKILFNSTKVRLKSDLEPDKITNKNNIILQPTDYFSSICTNEMICKKVMSRIHNREVFNGLKFIINNGYIDDLSKSNCSNHIGVSTIAFTSDGYMIITTQTTISAQSPGLYAPSGSGSADMKDLNVNSKIFQNFIINAIDRELSEECGIDNTNGLPKTHLIGFARYLNRGGKPEFFGVSFLDIPFDSLKINRKELSFVSKINTIRVCNSDFTKLTTDLKSYVDNNKDSFSFILYINFIFLIKYLESPSADKVQFICKHYNV